MSFAALALAGMVFAANAGDVPAKGPAPEAWPVTGERLGQAIAIERFDLKRRLTSYGSQYFRPDDKAQVLVVDGDLTIDGNLLLDWEVQGTEDGLLVTGDLKVAGAIVNANMNGGPFLLVGGETRAFAIVGGGAELVFEGNAVVADIVVGHYNDGILVFKKNLSAPAVVTMDHHLDIRGDLDGRWFDVFNGNDSWSTFLDARQPMAAMMANDEWSGLDKALIPALLQRRSVLRADLPAKSDHPKFGK